MCIEEAEMREILQLPDGRYLWDVNGEVMIKSDDGLTPYNPVDVPIFDKILRIKRVLESGCYEMIEGVLIDPLSAKAIILVYEGLKPENKLRFITRPIAQMGTIAWTLIG